MLGFYGFYVIPGKYGTLGTNMRDIDHSLVHSYQEVMGDCDAEDKWIDEHEREVVLVAMDDPDFCSCNLVFIPTKDMGFSCYRTSNCVAGEYVGFFYPRHVFTLAGAGEKLVQILEDWEYPKIGV